MSIYKRGKLYWYSFSVAGVKYQKSTKCTSQKEALQVEKEARKAVFFKHRQKQNGNARMTVADAVEKMINEEYKHAKTGDRSATQLEQAISHLPKTCKYLDDITRENMINVRDGFLKDGVKPQTANKRLAPFRKMMKLAASEWEVCEHVNAPKDLKFSSKKRRIMEFEEEALMLDFFRRVTDGGYVPPGSKYKKITSVRAYREMFIIYLETGMRLSELTSLKRDDIQWVGRYLTIHDPKNSVERDLPITDRCQESLMQLMALFPGGNRVVPFSQQSVSRHMKQLFVDAGLRNMTIHCLRHTFVTRRIAEGVPTMVVKELAGHKSVATTEKYAKVSMQTKQRAVGNKCSGKRSENGPEIWTSGRFLAQAES